MTNVFEVIDKSGRRVHLSNERWKHIRKKHPEIQDFEQIKETIQKPDKITSYNYDETVYYDETIYYFYKYYKNRPLSYRYLLVAVKYLNGEGYVATAYFSAKIK